MSVDDEHEAKTVRYVKRNFDGIIAGIAIAACVAIVGGLLWVFVKFGIE